MKVRDVMTRNGQVCEAGTNLAAAAMMMWDGDCGTLPVVQSDGTVIGMITDRDICMAVATKHRLASEIAVWEAITGKLYSCRPEDYIRYALKTMRAEKVRRLPVINADGKIEGVLSMNDLVLRAEEAKGKKIPELSHDEVMSTLKEICAHRVSSAA